MISPPFPAAALTAARDAAKAHLRIGDHAEDALIENMAATALALGEAFTGSAWIARRWEASIAADGVWHALGIAPVLAIEAVAGRDALGGAVALPGDAYAIDIDASGEGRVRVAQGQAATAAVQFDAGLAADWDALPAPLAQGAVLLTAHLLGQRDGTGAPPAAVAALWRPWRRVRLT